jgi:membrane associated rhomboid family serine protease
MQEPHLQLFQFIGQGWSFVSRIKRISKTIQQNNSIGNTPCVIFTLYIIDSFTRQFSFNITISWDNLLQTRYWALVPSSLAHADINHLLCNISALAANGPLFESFVGFRVALLFFYLASTVSGLISLKVHGHNVWLFRKRYHSVLYLYYLWLLPTKPWQFTCSSIL